jgi:hypothetical protein
MGYFDESQGDIIGEDILSDDLPIGMAGITPTTVTAGQTTTLAVPLNAFMRTDRLFLQAAATVALCYVNSLTIGTINLNVGPQPVAADAFRYDAVGCRLKGAVTANPSIPPAISVTNGTGASIVFAGSIFGPVRRG